MEKTVEAVFDGESFRPEDPLSLEPNTRVRLTIEIIKRSESKKTSFLRIARSLKLAGPPDWAENIDSYLYGVAAQSDE